MLFFHKAAALLSVARMRETDLAEKSRKSRRKTATLQTSWRLRQHLAGNCKMKQTNCRIKQETAKTGHKLPIVPKSGWKPTTLQTTGLQESRILSQTPKPINRKSHILLESGQEPPAKSAGQAKSRSKAKTRNLQNSPKPGQKPKVAS